ncbi:MAG: 2-oxo acid dehydrogenase subunit E2, partial [Alphaproteobacteria bacterium]
MTQFRLPDLGEGLQEAEIVTWHIGPGDHVVADQPLVAVETEKAVVEIPSPRSGHIKALLAKVGERVKVGAPLVEFEEGAHADTGAIVGELSQKPPSPMSPVSTTLAPLAAPAAAAAPAVRARARELGVDLAAIIGSGPGGAITRSDVERAAQASTGGDGKPLSAVRRAMAQAMARSRDEVTPATIYDDADVDHWPADAEVTLLLARAIAAAVAIVPVLNAAFDGARLALRSNSTVDLGVAVDTQDGLFVPILRDVGGRDIAALRGELARLVERVRSRTIELTDMRWPTIT